MQKITSALSLYPPFIGQKVKLYHRRKNICKFTTLDGKEQLELEIDQKKYPIKKHTIFQVPTIDEAATQLTQIRA